MANKKGKEKLSDSFLTKGRGKRVKLQMETLCQGEDEGPGREEERERAARRGLHTC